jgi:hypothetical protein
VNKIAYDSMNMHVKSVAADTVVHRIEISKLAPSTTATSHFLSILEKLKPLDGGC